MSDIRLVLTAEDFRDLVSGKAVESRDLQTGHNVKMILEDMGWDLMVKTIREVQVVDAFEKEGGPVQAHLTGRDGREAWETWAKEDKTKE